MNGGGGGDGGDGDGAGRCLQVSVGFLKDDKVDCCCLWPILPALVRRERVR